MFVIINSDDTNRDPDFMLYPENVDKLSGFLEQRKFAFNIDCSDSDCRGSSYKGFWKNICTGM